jgi:hypothetical protein
MLVVDPSGGPRLVSAATVMLPSFAQSLDAGPWDPETGLGSGRQAPGPAAEIVRFLTQGGFSLPKAGAYAKRILS